MTARRRDAFLAPDSLLSSAPSRAAVEQSPQTQLLEAIRVGDVEKVEEILTTQKSSIDLNDPNRDGFTAVHIATATKQLDIVRLLVDSGADPNCVDQNGDTPLHWACLAGSLEAVKVLLKRGADPTKRAHDGKTPLAAALEEKHAHVLQFLFNTANMFDLRAINEQVLVKGILRIKSHWKRGGRRLWKPQFLVLSSMVRSLFIWKTKDLTERADDVVHFDFQDLLCVRLVSRTRYAKRRVNVYVRVKNPEKMKFNVASCGIDVVENDPLSDEGLSRVQKLTRKLTHPYESSSRTIAPGDSICVSLLADTAKEAKRWADALKFAGITGRSMAAVRIQTAWRAWVARQTLYRHRRHLDRGAGLVRDRSISEGKRQGYYVPLDARTAKDFKIVAQYQKDPSLYKPDPFMYHDPKYHAERGSIRTLAKQPSVGTRLLEKIKRRGKSLPKESGQHPRKSRRVPNVQAFKRKTLALAVPLPSFNNGDDMQGMLKKRSNTGVSGQFGFYKKRFFVLSHANAEIQHFNPSRRNPHSHIHRVKFSKLLSVSKEHPTISTAKKMYAQVSQRLNSSSNNVSKTLNDSLDDETGDEDESSRRFVVRLMGNTAAYHLEAPTERAADEWVLALRRVLPIENVAALQIQRVVRGYMGRKRVREFRLLVRQVVLKAREERLVKIEEARRRAVKDSETRMAQEDLALVQEQLERDKKRSNHRSSRRRTSVQSDSFGGGKQQPFRVLTEHDDLGEWATATDPQSGRTYFYHTKTGETKWELTIADVPSARTEEEVRKDNKRDEEIVSSDDENDLPHGWLKRLDQDSGVYFYFNSNTGKSQWDLPTTSGLDDEEEDRVSEEPVRRITKWDEFEDPSSGDLFYVETLTGEKRWDVPEGGVILNRVSSSSQHAAAARDEYEYDPNWLQAVDPESGNAYYYHVETNETAWERPLLVRKESDNNDSSEQQPVEEEETKRIEEDPIASEAELAENRARAMASADDFEFDPSKYDDAMEVSFRKHVKFILEHSGVAKRSSSKIVDDFLSRTNSVDLYSASSTGELLCFLMHALDKDSLDLRAVNLDPTTADRASENFVLAVKAAQYAGCQIVASSISPAVLVKQFAVDAPLSYGYSDDERDEYEYAVVEFVWEALQLDLFKTVHVQARPDLLSLMEPGESLGVFEHIPETFKLARWLGMEEFGIDSSEFVRAINARVGCEDSSELADEVKEIPFYGNEFARAPQEDVRADDRFQTALAAFVFESNPHLEEFDLTEDLRKEMENLSPRAGGGGDSSDESHADEEDEFNAKEERRLRKWINSLNLELHGTEKILKISSVVDGLRDGLILCHLVRRVACECGFSEDVLNLANVHVVKNAMEMLDNCQSAFNVCADELQLKLVNISPLDIVDGRHPKLVLSLISQLHRTFTLGTLRKVLKGGSFAASADSSLNEKDVLNLANMRVASAASSSAKRSSLAIRRGSGLSQGSSSRRLSSRRIDSTGSHNKSSTGRNSQVLEISSFRDSALCDGVYLLTLLDAVRPQLVDWKYVMRINSEVENDDADEKVAAYEAGKANAQYVISLARKAGADVFVTWRDVVRRRSKPVLVLVAAILALDTSTSK